MVLAGAPTNGAFLAGAANEDPMDDHAEKTGSGPEQVNVRIAQRVWDEVWHQRHFGAINDLFDPGFTRHDLDPADGQGRKQNEDFIRRMRSAFPDLHFTVDDVIAKGDKVVTRYHFEGTHQGDALGFKATSKRVAYSGILIQRFERGRIVEQWTEANLLALFRQLGLVPDQKG
jgi:predicted ester cyclase